MTERFFSPFVYRVDNGKKRLDRYEDEHQLKLIMVLFCLILDTLLLVMLLSAGFCISQKNGMNGGQAITTWTSPTSSLKSNKPIQDDDRDPDVIPSYHQYGENK